MSDIIYVFKNFKFPLQQEITDYFSVHLLKKIATKASLTIVYK